MLALINNLTLTLRMAGHALAYFGSGRWHRATSPWPGKACLVPSDFFGICVANAPDPACDDYVVARLNELGIRHARLDFTYGDRDAFTERFLDRLLTDQFRVCLHLVQPREEAHAMLRNPEAAERWRTFVGDMLDRYGSRVESIEIGATCNRRKWAGYSPAAFFSAWQIAWEEARGRNLSIAGPNVTDFEPLYNAGWLGEFRRAGILPSVHTDNIFVERATEPEAFDHKIAGQRLAGLLRFNLVRKAQLLQDIGAWAGVPTLMCTHVAWSLRRIARFLEDVEEKQADYLARYACLAAASGALTRVYWGPLIGQREGLIDDGTSEYPEIPHVTYYEQARGAIKDYRLRPAFRTFQTVNRLLAGATFRRKPATGAGLEILEFDLNAEVRGQRSEIRDQAEEAGGQRTDDGLPSVAANAVSAKEGEQEEKQTSNIELATGEQALVRLTADRTSNIEGLKSDDRRQAIDGGVSRQKPEDLQSKIENRKSKILHVAWTTDGNGAGVDACYPPELLAQAEVYDRDGRRLERAPRMFSESPVYLMWPGGTWNAECRMSNVELSSQRSAVSGRPAGQIQDHQPSCLPKYRFARKTGWEFDIVLAENNALGLAGVYLAEDGGERVDIEALLELVTSNIQLATGEQALVRLTADRTSNTECRTADYGRQIADDGNPKSEIRNPKLEVLRAARNYVWSTNAPWNAEKTIVIKEFRPRSIFRRILNYGKPNKAQRSWNGAQELLRRGLATPTPLACLIPTTPDRHSTLLRSASYYICESFSPAWSVRDAFTAFSAGKTEFQGYSANDWYEAIADFLQKMHTRGVYFRDLSAGNLLVRRTPAGELEFALIDTARARFYPHGLGLRIRLCDLMRICHPLSWPCRRIFVEKYLAHNGRRFRWPMKIPFWFYDGKHRLKNAMKKIKLGRQRRRL